MAEAYPGISGVSPTKSVQCHDAKILAPTLHRQISVLTLTPQWRFDTMGLSGVTRSLVNNLRVLDPDARNIKIACAVLQEDGKIGEAEMKDAAKHGVRLKGAKLAKWRKDKQKLSWLNEDVAKYYQHILVKDQYDFIIGGLPYFTEGCLFLRDMSKELCEGHSPKVILVAHSLPMTEDGDDDEDSLLLWLNEADVVLSVGNKVFSKIESCIDSNDIDIDHKLYLPGFELDLFNIERKIKLNKLPVGEQNILMIKAGLDNFQASTLDFELAVTSSAKVSEKMLTQESRCLTDELSFTLKMLSERKDGNSSWKENFNQVKKNCKIEDHLLSFKYHAVQVTEDMTSYLKRACAFVLPLKRPNVQFGSEALVAIAAGIPVLVSKNSGIATFLQRIGEQDPIVWDTGKFANDVNIWKERLIEKLCDQTKAESQARELRKALLLGATIASTHVEFTKIICESLCIPLAIDMEDTVVSLERIEAAVKFGVRIDNPNDPVTTQAYVVAYFKHLICQREKLERGLLVQHIAPSVAEMWREVLSSLELGGRRLVDAGHGSLVLTLFCPTSHSAKQLQDENWKREILAQLTGFLTLLGVEGEVKIRSMDQPSPVVEAIKQKKGRDVSSSEFHSEGYETLTTSDLMSEDFPSEQKVADWLQHQQHGIGMAFGDSAQRSDLLLNLEETFPLNHLQRHPRDHMSIIKLAVSDSGLIAISDTYARPSLSVVNPRASGSGGGSSSSLVFSSTRNIFRSAVFVNVSGRECVAVSCRNEGSIHLLDTETLTSSIVYEDKQMIGKRMNICKIDETTVAYGDVEGPEKCLFRIYVLGINTKQWKIKNMLLLNIWAETIYDMCYLKTADGTACLVLSCPADDCIQAVEMVGGRTRWKSANNDESGKTFCPWTVCTAGHDTVYALDLSRNMLCVMSAEDGAAVCFIGLQPFGVILPSCVRMLENHIYVGHRDSKTKAHAVSIFTRNMDIH